ncbi:MAG: hypothetical protein IGS48_12985 [Oscillatoriales cyanobacterium C42_A2020_001]|nr:hypothetical protein [Leptolyngbyaceae cyanobacterium C42_A2020_001]
MKPEDYLNSWVPKLYGIQPDARGYRKACIDEIHRVTGISKNTINTWGALFENCPEHVHYTLKWVDSLNRIRELVALTVDLPED